MGSSCYAAYYYQDLKEWYIYGSESDGRISVLKPYVNEFTDHLHKNAIHSFDQAEPYAMKDTIIEYQANTIGSFTSNARITGHKEYEIKDHLGNVRAVISDVKNPNNLSSSISSWTFTAEIRNLNSYYPYGMELPGGAYASIGNYGYGYNGMEKDDELKGSGKTYTTKFRQASTVEGTWWGRDPLEMSMPYQSPYILMSGNPIARIDPNGDADYYSQDGDKVGSNDPSDENNYLLVEESDVELAENGDFDNFTGKIITFPIDENIKAIESAVHRVSEPTKDDEKGGYHEEAVMLGTNTDNGENIVVNMKPGPYVDISKGEVGHVDIINPIEADKEKFDYLWANLNNIFGVCHIHNTRPLTKIDPFTGKYLTWTPGYKAPSPKDIIQVEDFVSQLNVNWLWMQVGKDYIYFYGRESENIKGKRYYAKFPLDEFFELAE